jgi:histidine triad (HIT) family protein
MAAESNCLFCKIAAGGIPAKKVYEDDELIAFHDIHPWAPVHILIVPKRHITSMTDITEADAPLLGRMMAISPRLMRELGVNNGFRHVINTGSDGGQEVMHIHLHVMGGPRPWLKG